MKAVTDRNALLSQSNDQILPEIFILSASKRAVLHWSNFCLLLHSPYHSCFPCCNYIDYICLILDSLSCLSHSLWFYNSLFLFTQMIQAFALLFLNSFWCYSKNSVISYEKTLISAGLNISVLINIYLV